MSIKRTGLGKKAVGLGTRLNNTGVSLGISEDILDRFSVDGYQLILSDDYLLTLYRVNSSTSVQLFQVQMVGTVSLFKWFHFRLDFLIQSDNRAVLQVFQNDLAINSPVVPSWQQISPDIIDNVSAVPQFTDVGLGGQLDTGEPTFLDRVEIFRT